MIILSFLSFKNYEKWTAFALSQNEIYAQNPNAPESLRGSGATAMFDDRKGGDNRDDDDSSMGEDSNINSSRRGGRKVVGSVGSSESTQVAR